MRGVGQERGRKLGFVGGFSIYQGLRQHCARPLDSATFFGLINFQVHHAPGLSLAIPQHGPEWHRQYAKYSPYLLSGFPAHMAANVLWCIFQKLMWLLRREAIIRRSLSSVECVQSGRKQAGVQTRASLDQLFAERIGEPSTDGVIIK